MLCLVDFRQPELTGSLGGVISETPADFRFDRPNQRRRGAGLDRASVPLQLIRVAINSPAGYRLL